MLRMYVLAACCTMLVLAVHFWDVTVLLLLFFVPLALVQQEMAFLDAAHPLASAAFLRHTLPLYFIALLLANVGLLVYGFRN